MAAKLGQSDISAHNAMLTLFMFLSGAWDVHFRSMWRAVVRGPLRVGCVVYGMHGHGHGVYKCPCLCLCLFA